MEKKGVIHGAISRFNLDDIKFFTEEKDFKKRDIQIDDMVSEIKHILAKRGFNGMSLGWVPSPKTCHMMLDYLYRSSN